jgi:hypothetical protein
LFLASAFMALALAVIALTYGIACAVLWLLGHSFGLPERYWWAPLAGTGLLLLIAVVTVVRKRIPDITRLKWDSGTIQDSPSRVGLIGFGGRLWNVNPVGPRSVASAGKIGGAFLCAGPSLAITALLMAADSLKRNVPQPRPDARSDSAQTSCCSRRA